MRQSQVTHYKAIENADAYREALLDAFKDLITAIPSSRLPKIRSIVCDAARLNGFESIADEIYLSFLK